MKPYTYSGCTQEENERFVKAQESCPFIYKKVSEDEQREAYELVSEKQDGHEPHWLSGLCAQHVPPPRPPMCGWSREPTTSDEQIAIYLKSVEHHLEQAERYKKLANDILEKRARRERAIKILLSE